MSFQIMNRVFEFKALFSDKLKGSAHNGTAVANFYSKKKKRKRGDLQLTQHFSNISCISIISGLVKAQTAGPTSRVSGSVGLRWDQRICISYKFPDLLMLLVLSPHFENH